MIARAEVSRACAYLFNGKRCREWRAGKATPPLARYSGYCSGDWCQRDDRSRVREAFHNRKAMHDKPTYCPKPVSATPLIAIYPDKARNPCFSCIWPMICEDSSDQTPRSERLTEVVKRYHLESPVIWAFKQPAWAEVHATGNNSSAQNKAKRKYRSG